MTTVYAVWYRNTHLYWYGVFSSPEAIEQYVGCSVTRWELGDDRDLKISSGFISVPMVLHPDGATRDTHPPKHKVQYPWAGEQ